MLMKLLGFVAKVRHPRTVINIFVITMLKIYAEKHIGKNGDIYLFFIRLLLLSFYKMLF